MRLCFVLPRFGEKIYGGAEFLTTSIARKLAERGEQVEILSTCAIDNRTWENHFAEGRTTELGMTVQRFAVDDRDLDCWIPKQIAISEGFRISVEDQLDWMQHSVNASKLYAYIAQHKSDFDYFFFAPYLFGTTFWGSQVCPEKSILFPCLHDESQAYTDVIASMFRNVRGCLFNARAEQELAEALYGTLRGTEVGLGFEQFSEQELSNLKYPFDQKFPYVLCLGRKETGKNAQVLIDDFIAAKENFPQLAELKLVIAGGGSFSDLHRDEALKRPDIIDVQALSEVEKRALIANALCLCNPSVNEYFSIVIMEAWLQHKPVLVSSKCAVTREHVVESSGGMDFQDANDLAGVLMELLQSTTLEQELGQNGFNYVTTKYSWPAVIDRFYAGIKEISA
mgnify:CR=1 FL=1